MIINHLFFKSMINFSFFKDFWISILQNYYYSLTCLHQFKKVTFFYLKQADLHIFFI